MIIFVSAIPYNQSQIRSNARWNPTGITFANSTGIGSQLHNTLIDRNNAIYVFSPSSNPTRISFSENTSSGRNIFTNFSSISGLFVASNGDIYVGSDTNGQVAKWTSNDSNSISVTNFSSKCFSLFVDINNALYCSMENRHQIMKTLLNNSTPGTFIIVAGSGSSGSLSNMLYSPRGIFVSTNLDLYVADYNNNRVQLFRFGQLNATTVVGSGARGTATLSCPTAIIMDEDGYMFIADSCNNRIIGSGPGGFWCVVGCSSTPGSAADQLYHPEGLAFDSCGNLFVFDRSNYRIQKFLSTTTTCSKY